MRNFRGYGRRQGYYNPRRYTLRYGPEENEQREVAQYLREHYLGVKFTISPANIKVSQFMGHKLVALGYNKGTPDITIYKSNGKSHGLVIEMKAPAHSVIGKDGTPHTVPAGRPTKEQIEWVDYLNREGYRACFCVGASEAIKVIDEYFKPTL